MEARDIGEEVKNGVFLRKIVATFSFFADIPDGQNRSRGGGDRKKVAIFSKIAPHFRFYSPIYPVCKIARGSVAMQKSDVFFGILYRIPKILLIYQMCNVVAGTDGAGGGENKRDFFENLYRISLFPPDIPNVRTMPQRMATLRWGVAERKIGFFHMCLVDFSKKFRRDNNGKRCIGMGKLKKMAFFFGKSLPLLFFLLIYPMCEIGRG